MAGKHRDASEPATDPRARKVPGRRPGPKHASDDAPRKTAPRKAAPRKATAAEPVSAPPAPDKPKPKPSRFNKRGAVDAARGYADRAAMRATSGGKPSVTGRAASGAAAGAASGAAIGGPVGAAAGGILGGAGGAISGARAKKAHKAEARAAAGTGGARRALVAEFAICLVVVALSPITSRKRDEPAGPFMKRMTALLGVFFILGLISAGGRGMARAAAAFGGVITVALAVSERDLFTELARIFNNHEQKTVVDRIAPAETGD